MDVERLDTALLTIYLHHSGLLTVECIQPATAKRGELYLLAGQPTYACTEGEHGQAALVEMLTWRPIRLTFRTNAPRPPANLPSYRGIPSSARHLSSRGQGAAPPDGPLHRSIGEQAGIARRAGSEPYALSLPLTHRERQIYCLIDGQRTMADLVRCSGKTWREVETVLHALHRRGLLLRSLPEEGHE